METPSKSSCNVARYRMGCRSDDGGGSAWRRRLVATCACLFWLGAWGHDGKVGCGGRDKLTWATPDPKARIDHSPKHGGIHFNAPNDYHHLEAVYVRPSLLKIYFYDPFGEPIQAAYFRGTVRFRDESGRRPTALSLSDDGTLVASLPPKPFPLILDAQISYGGPIAGPKAFAKQFTFGFDRVSALPDGPPAETTSER